jgi:hypothetical protein
VPADDEEGGELVVLDHVRAAEPLAAGIATADLDDE